MFFSCFFSSFFSFFSLKPKDKTIHEIHANLCHQTNPTKAELQFNGPSFIMCLYMFLQMTTLENPATHSLHNFFFFLRYKFENPAPHSLQLSGLSPLCILVCCFRLPLLTNSALNSLQLYVFPPSVIA